MKELIDYVTAHAIRGQCRCGQCIDAGDPKDQPTGHTVNLEFFDVAIDPKAPEPAMPEKLEELVRANVHGTFSDLDLFDGKEHSYLQIGAWIGDQGGALMLMGLGKLLGCWELMTPHSMLGKIGVPEEIMKKMAGQGFITIQAKKHDKPKEA